MLQEGDTRTIPQQLCKDLIVRSTVSFSRHHIICTQLANQSIRIKLSGREYLDTELFEKVQLRFDVLFKPFAVINIKMAAILQENHPFRFICRRVRLKLC